MSDPTTTPTPTEPHHDVRERAGRALYEHRQAAEAAPQDGYTAWDDLPEDWQDEYREAADAVLAAVSAAAPDERWWESLVQAECEVGHVIFIDDGDGTVYACPACALAEARAALAARPAPCEREATPDEAHDIGYTKGHTDGYREAMAEAAARPAPTVSGEDVECDHAKAAREIARTTPLSLDAATALIDSLARGAATLADAWDEGYGAAETKARMWGHTDHWETGPENPYRLTVADEGRA